ncbi:MAG: CPBP family intramembrane glutamic endopeptidase [Pricia sp.]
MYIAQAYRGNNAAWRVILTVFVATGFLLLNFVVFLITSKEDMEKVYELMKSMSPILNLVSNLVPFVFLLGVLIIMVVLVHQRSFLSLTTARPMIDFSRIFFSAMLIIGLTVALFAVSYYLDPSEIAWNFNPGKFAILFGVSILLFPFQIGYEEYLFRGYLMQQIGILFKNRWFPLLLTSVLFGVLHSANPEVAEMGYITMVFYIGFGLLMGVMTLMDDGLELALGFHLGNNLMAALLITSEWSALQTDALFKYTAENASDGAVQEMLLSVGLTFPVILFVLARKYKWTNWQERLTGKVPSQETFLAQHADEITLPESP